MNRSENMRRIRSRDTKPELTLRRALFRRGLRYRCNLQALPGTPDIVFTRAKVAVFVQGCFWHQHPGCREASKPKSNTAYWMPKLARNVERDAVNRQKLEASGFEVVVAWECEIELNVEDEVKRIASIIERRLHRQL